MTPALAPELAATPPSWRGKPIQPSQLVRLVARVTGHGTGILH